jgi:hypothetical protein
VGEHQRFQVCSRSKALASVQRLAVDMFHYVDADGAISHKHDQAHH